MTSKRKIIKRYPKPIKKISRLSDNKVTKITIKLDGKIYKDKNSISFSNHEKPSDFSRRIKSPGWKFYPYCTIGVHGKFGYSDFTLGKKNTIQKKREREETERLKKSKLKYPRYYNFDFDDDTLTFSFKYEGVFDDIDSGNGEYNVKQAFEIKFERPIDYKKLKECMIEYLEKIGKFYQPKD